MSDDQVSDGLGGAAESAMAGPQADDRDADGGRLPSFLREQFYRAFTPGVLSIVALVEPEIKMDVM